LEIICNGLRAARVKLCETTETNVVLTFTLHRQRLSTEAALKRRTLSYINILEMIYVRRPAFAQFTFAALTRS
jgi:hypothetical protein